MRKAFYRMLENLLGSRKFTIGMPTLIGLLCLNKIPPEIFIAGFIALFATNSYDKKKVREHGESIQ